MALTKAGGSSLLILVVLVMGTLHPSLFSHPPTPPILNLLLLSQPFCTEGHHAQLRRGGDTTGHDSQ